MATPWPSPVVQATDAAAVSNPLSPYANARLLQFQNLIPGDMDSPRLWRHVFECFLRRGNYITAKENGPGVDTGDFTYSGFICRASRLPMQSADPLDWLSASLPAAGQHSRGHLGRGNRAGALQWADLAGRPEPAQ
jgi:hypothetical protein